MIQQKVKGNRIITSVGIVSPVDKDLGRTYGAIWDTGSTGTLISPKVVAQLNLKRSRSADVETGMDHITKSWTYDVVIILENHSKSITQEVIEFPGKAGCDVLIGMDIISHGEFHLILDDENNNIFNFKIDKLL